jgi:AcrR family transcriptional regulator
MAEGQNGRDFRPGKLTRPSPAAILLTVQSVTMPRATAIDHAAASPGTSPTRQRRKEARPQELLDAALALFVEKGFAATRSEEVAARAGVSKGTLYLYFPSKEELFKAVVRSNLSALIAEGQTIADGFDGPTSDLLRLLLRTWWARIGLTPAGGITKVILAEVRNFPDLAQFWVDEVILPAQQLLAGTIRRGIDRGEFRAVPVHDAVHALVAPSLFLAMHKHSIGACPVQGVPLLHEGDVIDTQIDLVLKGLERRDGVGDGVGSGAKDEAARS